MIYHDVAPNQSTTVGDLVVCVDRPGSVEIKRIELRKGFGGLLLEQFAAIPTSGSKGSTDAHKPIKELVGDIITEPVILHGQCPVQTSDASTSRNYWLLLQYARPAARTAGNHGIVIWYESAGREHSLFVNWQILLCDESDTAMQDCQS